LGKILTMRWLCVFLISISAGLAADIAPVLVSIDGNRTTLYSVSMDWQTKFVSVTPSGSVANLSKLSLNGGGRFYVAKNPMPKQLVADEYFQVNLLGKALSYTLDLSNVGCSCNSAFYFVSMPGANKTSIDSRGGEYYCGANAGKGGRGNYCPEMDIIEANKFALQSTPHTCDTPIITPDGGKYYDQCDHRGCFVNSWLENNRSMCPSSECIIDTTKPFRHTVEFHVNDQSQGGYLSQIRNVLKQQGRAFEFVTCRSESYLKHMSASLKSMVPVFSLWGSSNAGMGWLDNITKCAGDCNVRASSTYFSDITLDNIM